MVSSTGMQVRMQEEEVPVVELTAPFVQSIATLALLTLMRSHQQVCDLSAINDLQTKN